MLALAGVPRVTYHGLRHSYATMLADAGISGILHMRLMGHKVPSSWDQSREPVGPLQPLYIHLTAVQLAQARHKIDVYLDEVAAGAELG